jgi:hypothetical protein
VTAASLTERVPLRYWRAALAEVSLLHPEVPPERESIAIDTDDRGWFVACAPGGVAAWVDEQFAASKATRGANQPTVIPFVLVPARLSERASHGAKPDAADIHKGASILCVPCLLDRDGGLRPDPDRHPWIPREFLEPTPRLLSMGTLESYDAFISRLPRKAQSFNDTLRAATELLAAVAGASLPLLPWSDVDEGEPLPVLDVDGHELVSEWHGLPYEPPVVARHLIRLYDRLIDDRPPTPLLDTLRTITDRPTAPPVALADAQRWHTATLGHVNTRHPLSPSQREAMVALVQAKDGQVVSVNGPPGTGKTTLLHGVVAQCWVDAALREAACPLVLVASTNAKAVENVLESFARICADIGHRRWHPYDGGFGLFLASESRESAHPTCTGVSRHPFTEFETAQGVEEVRQHYLAHAAALFEAPQESVDPVVRMLHGRLRQHERTLREIVEARYAVFDATGQSVDDGAASSCLALLARHQAALEATQAGLRDEQAQLAHCHQASSTARRAAKDRRGEIDLAEQGWTAYLAAAPLWLDLLTFLPAVRRRRGARDRNMLLSNPLTADRRDRDDDMPAHFSALRTAARDDEARALTAISERAEVARRNEADHLRRAAQARAAADAINLILERWRSALGSAHAELLDVSLTELNDALDTRLRAPMFSLADWYWSGRWLLEMQTRLDASERDTKGRQRLEAMYRRFAKLSPCLVSNFHMAPSFFTAWQGEDMPMWGAIDLLVVDEAGQVTPEVGAPAFALARRAMVVGDVHQIEPVWGVGEGIDRVNAAAAGLTGEAHDPRYDELARGGYTCAAGSLMHMANRACELRKYPEIRGLMLTEHRRCVPELIRYCNELIYDGRLQPLRPALPALARLLPAFGRLDVRGRDRPVGKSRQNLDEAEAVVAWLKTHRTRIEAHYCDGRGEPTPLWKLVGIVTPFATQAGAIERVLRREMRQLTARHSRLTVGTVHALQGAERAIVIFSPSYGIGYQGGMFFDKTPNMLNVAVSRAKDSFLIIGNLDLFDGARASRPSGLLARFLHGDASAVLAPSRSVTL